MEKAWEKFDIGQYVEILVRNSHYGDIGKIVGFDAHNEYNVKVALDDGFIQGYMTAELRAIPRLGQKRSLIGRIKSAYYRWRNSDTVKHCPVYKNKGCSHVYGMLCKFPDCNTYHEYMGHTFCICANCLLNSNCMSRNYGLGCYDGRHEDCY